MYPTYEECVRSAKKEYDLPSSVFALPRNDFADDNLIQSEIYESRSAMEVDLLWMMNELADDKHGLYIGNLPHDWSIFKIHQMKEVASLLYTPQ